MATYLPGLNFPIYSGWTQYTPVIPKLYWDVYSAEQRMKMICLNYDKVEHYLDYIAEMMNSWNVEFTEQMQAEFAAMWEAIHGEFKNTFEPWFNEHIDDYLTDALKQQVFFGLTLDGYFVAYIPDSWDEIIFDTGAVYGREDYGRLILKYQVDSVHDVQQ